MIERREITFPYPLTGKRVLIGRSPGLLADRVADALQDQAALVVDGDQTRAGLAANILEVRPDAVIFFADIADATAPLKDRIDLQDRIFQTAFDCGVEKLMFAAPAVVYPASAPQPVMEIFVEDGPGAADMPDLAKLALAGLRSCAHYRTNYGADFIAAVHATLFGPGEIEGAVAELISAAQRDGRRGLSEQVFKLGGGSRLEALHTTDAASALVHLLAGYTGEMHVNVGAGYDISVGDLAAIIADIGRLPLDASDATSRRETMARHVLNVRRLAATGWQPRIGLREGIAETWGAMAAERR